MTQGPWEEAAAAHSARVAAEVRGREPSGRKLLIWNLISTVLTAAFLAFFMGPIVALAGVFGIFVHEYGHVLAMNRMGCGPARIHIVPFLGGAAVPARAASTEFKDVLISLAGPVFGLLAVAPFFLLFAATGEKAWLEGAFFIAVINLLNLAPAPPLDGSKALGPALAKAHPGLERVALVVVGAAAVWWALERNAFFIALFIAISILGALRRGSLRPLAIRLSGAETAWTLALYAGAAALCLLTMAAILMGLGRPVTPDSLLGFFAVG